MRKFSSAAAPLRLNAKALVKVALPKPQYDRSAVQPGITHLGVGGFFRSHLAVYNDDLLNKGAHADTNDWGICGVGLLPFDAGMNDAMKAQDSLYTVVSKDGESATPRVIGSMVNYLYAPDTGAEPVLHQLTSPVTKIVSMTVTEKGYYYDPMKQSIDLSSEAVQFDIVNKTAPKTAPGLIIAALKRRMDAGQDPFSVLSCDNLENNGEVIKKVVLELAGEMEGGEFANWVESNVAFPCSMVDRITPGTQEDDMTYLRTEHGLEDQWPVVCEDFRQWVIEDKFCTSRPCWEEAGAMIVPDVYPYELMKLRLLNTSHSALAYLSYLNGERIVHEAMHTELIGGYVQGYMDEVQPSCLPVPGVDMQDYKDTLLKRFGNAGVKDQIQRLAEDGSTKMGNVMLPIIRENLEAGRSVRHLATAIAAYASYMTGTDRAGQPIFIKDPKSDTLTPKALEAQQTGDPRQFIGELFGPEMASESAAQFTDNVRDSLALINSGAGGVENAILAAAAARD
jgi:mannitol 2-dehydrogenase